MTLHQPIVRAVMPAIWQITVPQFLLLEAHGSFADHAKAELLDGEIWVVNAIHSRHAAMQAELNGRLWAAVKALDADLTTFATPSVEIGERSLPEPDLVVGQAHGEGFLPTRKVRLVIEVSDTTLDVDLGRKLRLYASAGIAEYWVVNVDARTVHQFWLPVGERYGEQRTIGFGEPLTAATIGDLTIATDGL